MVYRLALRTLRHQEDAEDATQETLLNMNRYLDTFDPTRPLEPWLGRITYNVCLKRLGKASTKRDLMTEPEALDRQVSPLVPSPEAVAASHEAGALVARAVEQLPAQDRFLIQLRYREGQTDVEVAEATGMNVNTVRTRLFRARKALRKLLAPALAAGRGEAER